MPGIEGAWAGGGVRALAAAGQHTDRGLLATWSARFLEFFCFVYELCFPFKFQENNGRKQEQSNKIDNPG